MPAACAIARKCSTALVEPPTAMIRLTAFSIESRVMMSLGRRLLRIARTSTRALSAAESTFSWSGLAIVDEYSRLMPSASNDELIVLAVYMPPQEPEPGMQRRSISLKSVSFIRPAVSSPTASNADTMVRSLSL